MKIINAILVFLLISVDVVAYDIPLVIEKSDYVDIKTIFDAQKRYHAAHGKYAADYKNLDLPFKDEIKPAGDHAKHSNDGYNTELDLKYNNKFYAITADYVMISSCAEYCNYFTFYYGGRTECFNYSYSEADISDFCKNEGAVDHISSGTWTMPENTLDLLSAGKTEEFKQAVEKEKEKIKNSPEAKLLQAASDDDLEALKKILKTKVNVNKSPAYNLAGSTPLDAAVDKNNIEAVKLLLAKGAVPHDIEPAINNDNIDMLRLLLQKGGKELANQDNNDMPSASMLMLAIDKNSMPMVNLLLEYGADPNRGTVPPLITVLYGGEINLEVLQALLEAGANINRYENYCVEATLPPVFMAARNESGNALAAVKMLVERKADLSPAAEINPCYPDAETKTQTLAETAFRPEVQEYIKTLGGKDKI